MLHRNSHVRFPESRIVRRSKTVNLTNICASRFRLLGPVRGLQDRQKFLRRYNAGHQRESHFLDRVQNRLPCRPLRHKSPHDPLSPLHHHENVQGGSPGRGRSIADVREQSPLRGGEHARSFVHRTNSLVDDSLLPIHHQSTTDCDYNLEIRNSRNRNSISDFQITRLPAFRSTIIAPDGCMIGVQPAGGVCLTPQGR